MKIFEEMKEFTVIFTGVQQEVDKPIFFTGTRATNAQRRPVPDSARSSDDGRPRHGGGWERTRWRRDVADGA